MKGSINITVGNKIRCCREEQQLSQEDLAFLSNLHKAYIGQIERAEKNIGLQNLEKIANALKIPIKDLFE
jgi:transcriptional regulator with XRE-family HTH domain